jgi:hypothetical protein
MVDARTLLEHLPLLQAYPIKIDEDSYAVVVGNIGSDVSAEDAKKALAAVVPSGKVSSTSSTSKTAVLRFDASSAKNQTALFESLKTVCHFCVRLVVFFICIVLLVDNFNIKSLMPRHRYRLYLAYGRWEARKNL